MFGFLVRLTWVKKRQLPVILMMIMHVVSSENLEKVILLDLHCSYSNTQSI